MISLRQMINSHSPYSRYMACLLALVLAFQPGVSLGFPGSKKELPVHVPEFEGQAFEGIGHFARPSEAANNEEWNEYLNEKLRNRRISNIERVLQSGDDPTYLTAVYTEMFGKGMERIDSMMERFSFDAVMEKVEEGRVQITDPELGTMEFTRVGDEIEGKIIHENSGVAWLFYNEDRTSKDDIAHQTYIAKQHYDSGSTRDTRRYIDENGKKRKYELGRDTVVVGVRGRAIGEDGVEILPRQRGFKNWWRATYEKPTAHDRKWGLIGASVQTGIVSSMGVILGMALSKGFGYEMPMDNAPLYMGAVTFAFAGFLGVYNTLYQNFKNRGSKRARDLKNGGVKVGYYMLMSLIGSAVAVEASLFDFSMDTEAFVAQADQALQWFENFNFQSVADKIGATVDKVKGMSWLAIALALHPFHNFLAANEFKNYTFYKQEIPRRMNEDRGTKTFELPFWPHWKVETDLEKRYYHRQFKYYIPVSSLKTMDQIWFSFSILPAMSGDLPAWLPLLSPGIYWASLVGTMRGVMKWAYRGKRQESELENRAELSSEKISEIHRNLRIAKAADELHMAEDMRYYFPIKSYVVPRVRSVWNRLKGLNQKLKKSNTEIADLPEKAPDTLPPNRKGGICDRLLSKFLPPGWG